MLSEIKGGPRGWLILLILAACLHVVSTSGVFLIGRFGLMPSQFDRNGVGEFAPDGRSHQQDAVVLTDKLSHEGIRAWLKAIAPLHVRLYSLSQVFLSRFIGFNILAVEPMNLIYYLSILIIVYKIAEAVFDRCSALLAAAVVGLWPTLLLHTTQPLRDPLLITVVMIFFLIVTRWLAQRFSWKQTILASVAGSLVLLVIWIVRLAMWDCVQAVLYFAALLLLIRIVKDRRLLLGNVIVGVVLIGTAWVIPNWNHMLQFTEKRERDVRAGKVLIGERVIPLTVWDRIAARREGFTKKTDDDGSNAGSNIDNDVSIKGKAALFRYLPRAAEIGLFAPFPNMWFARGMAVGRGGRILSGLEMVLTYLIEALAVYALWWKRRHLSVWLLICSALLGTLALGLIVANVGSLYRLRYPFWILLVIMGTGGAIHFFSARKQRKAQAK